MKYAIDLNVERRCIGGWVACDSPNEQLSCKVRLYRGSELLGETNASNLRNDVRLAGLHSSGHCGFDFGQVQLSVGSFYTVEVTGDNQCVAKTTVLFGDHKELLDEFSRFEVARDDFSIMAIPTESLSPKHNDILLLKKLLIRLRRAKRALGWRLKFEGVPYHFQGSDWAAFEKLVRDNIDSLIQFLPTRFVWSIVDTFVDYCTDDERYAALAISNLLAQERFAQTFHCIYEMKERPTKITNKQHRYWGDMGSNRLSADDAYDVFITRNVTYLEKYPLMYKIFIHCIREMMRSNDSILSINMQNSEYFSAMADFYRKHL